MRFFILATVCVLIAGASAKPTISLRELINEILKGKETEGGSDISKRQQCAAKFPRTHTACLNDPRREEEGVSGGEANAIVAKHNALRRGVNPTATNMKTMRWDNEIAMIAQKWASHCQFAHDENRNRNIPNRVTVGQNVAYDTYPNKDWTDTIQRWYDEVNHFKFGSGSTNGKAVGHYTQVVWAESYLLGCGYAKCNFGHLYVCDYGPAGNNYFTKNTPYKTDGSSNPSGNNNGGNNNNNNNNGGNGGSNNNNGGSGNNGGNSGGNWNTKDGCTIDGRFIPGNSSRSWRVGSWLKTCKCTIRKSGNYTSKSYSCGFRYAGK